MSIGWAIVSTGRHSDQKMAPAISASQDAVLSAVFSRDLNRARSFAKRHGASAAYDSFEALLRDPSVDVVYIASPNSLHSWQAVMAAQAGKHVLCEKPMALTIDECELMIQACNYYNVQLGVGFHLRQHPGVRQLRDLVQRGLFGSIALIQSQWGYGARGLIKPRPRQLLSQWWENPAMVGAGAWMGSGIHCLDLMRYVLGEEVVEVTAITDASDDEPLENLIAVLLRFENNTLGMITASRRIPDSRNDLTVYGSLGRGAMNDGLYTDLQGQLEVVSETRQIKEDYGPPDPLAMYIRQVESFNRAVTTSSQPDATGMDGLKGVAATLAILESSTTGQRVSLLT